MAGTPSSVLPFRFGKTSAQKTLQSGQSVPRPYQSFQVCVNTSCCTKIPQLLFSSNTGLQFDFDVDSHPQNPPKRPAHLVTCQCKSQYRQREEGHQGFAISLLQSLTLPNGSVLGMSAFVLLPFLCVTHVHSYLLFHNQHNERFSQMSKNLASRVDFT